MPDVLLTTAETAERMKRSKRWIQSIILRGKLPAQMVGNTYVVRLKDVERYKHLPRGQSKKIVRAKLVVRVNVKKRKAK